MYRTWTSIWNYCHWLLLCSVLEMPCVQAQYASLPHDAYFSSEFLNPDLSAKLMMDINGQKDQLSTSSLPSINTLVGTGYMGEFDAYSCKITTSSPASTVSFSPAAVAENSCPQMPSQALKLDDLQVYGCYPGSFALSCFDETLSSCGSDYYGSPVYAAASPPTPGFQAQPAPVWDSPFSPYPQAPPSSVPDKPAMAQQLSFFTFSPTPEQHSPLGQHQDVQPGQDDPFFLSPQQHLSPLHCPPMSLEHRPLESPRLVESTLMSPKTHNPGSTEGRCAVCGDNASCQHYGVRTCEGCKGFFKVNSWIAFCWFILLSRVRQRQHISISVYISISNKKSLYRNGKEVFKCSKFVHQTHLGHNTYISDPYYECVKMYIRCNIFA